MSLLFATAFVFLWLNVLLYGLSAFLKVAALFLMPSSLSLHLSDVILHFYGTH